MSKRSLTFQEKLDRHFRPDPVLGELDSMLTTSRSACRFDSRDDLNQHLVEGALLNISVIGSKALSVPCGEYMVWMTDAGHTMLVPVSEANRQHREVFEQATDQYEVLTRDLLANWNKVERVLSEEDEDWANLRRGGNEENLQEPAEGGEPGEGAEEFRSTVDVSTVDRLPILRAMQDRGYTVTSLADETGVDPPAISRILREPADTQGDPGGRNPSMGLAAKICNVLRIDPTAAFPDIFGTRPRYEPRNQPGNSQSGAHGWGGGGRELGIGESVDLYESINLLESRENHAIFETMCKQFALTGVPFRKIWRECLEPTLRRSQAQTVRELLREFQQAAQKQPWYKRWFGLGGGETPAAPAAPATKPARPQASPRDDAANQAYADRLARNKAAGRQPTNTPYTDKRQSALQQKITDMNKQVWMPIRQAWAKALNDFKKNAQELQYQQGVDPKKAPHAWKLVDMFYKHVMSAAAKFEPPWKKQRPGETPGYAGDYERARGEFQKLQGGGGGAGDDGGGGDDGSDPLDPGGTLIPGGGGAMTAGGQRVANPTTGGALATRQGGGVTRLGGGGGAAATRRPTPPQDDVIDAEYEVKQPQRALPGRRPLALPGR